MKHYIITYIMDGKEYRDKITGHSVEDVVQFISMYCNYEKVISIAEVKKNG